MRIRDHLPKPPAFRHRGLTVSEVEREMELKLRMMQVEEQLRMLKIQEILQRRLRVMVRARGMVIHRVVLASFLETKKPA